MNWGEGIVQVVYRDKRSITLMWSTSSDLDTFSEEYALSRCIEVFGRTFRFLLYRNGRGMGFPEWTVIEVREVDWRIPTPLLLTLGIQNVNRTDEVKCYNERFPVGCCFWRDKFVRLSELQDRADELASFGQINVSCTFSIEGKFKITPEKIHSYFQERGCFFHKQVEWNVSPELLKTGKYLITRCFKIKDQNFKLGFEYSESTNVASLLLYRKGSSMTGPSCFVRWWAELKLSHGSSHHKNMKGEFDLIEDISAHKFSKIKLGAITYEELIDYCLIGPVTVVFRITTEQAIKPAEECTHGVAKISAPGFGKIKEEECPSHKQVKWCFDYNLLRNEGIAISPQFTVGEQSYKLEIYLDKLSVKWCLNLYSDKSSITHPHLSVRWWAGIIHNNGTHHFPTGSGILNLMEESEIWTQKRIYELNFAELKPCLGLVTIFFRMSMPTRTRQRSLTAAKACIHDAFGIELLPEPDACGIVVDECSTHTQVVWVVQVQQESRYPTFEDDYTRRSRVECDLISPEFAIGSQHFMFHLHRHDCILELTLYCRGSSAGYGPSVRWWMGFQRQDRTCFFSGTSGMLDPQDVCDIWTKIGEYSVSEHNVRRWTQMTNGGRHIPFLRMSMKEDEGLASTSKKELGCIHRIADSWHVIGDGCIQEIESSSYNQMNWEVSIKDDSNCPRKCRKCISPEFTIGGQKFKFELFQVIECKRKTLIYLELRLYSKVLIAMHHSPYRQWWAGLKHSNGMYLERNMCGVLDLEEGCDIWTFRGSQKFNHLEILCQLKWSYKLTAFFRLSKEASLLTTAKMYIPDTLELQSRHRNGSILEREFSNYKQIDWSLNYYKLPPRLHVILSPVFEIGTERFVLELSPNLNAADSTILSVYRSGSSISDASRLARWWAGLKRVNGTYHYRNERGEMDLNECDMWRHTRLLTINLNDVEKELQSPDDHLTIFFRLSTNTAEVIDSDNDREPEREAKKQRRADDSDVIFQVKSVQLRIPKTILETRIPLFKAMFSHDSIEKKTGIVSIRDVQPAVFEEFLSYLTTGFVCKLTVSKALALYAVAHKYMVDDIQADCLHHVSENLSVRSFFDVVSFALKYEEDNLLSDVINFLSQNKNIMKTNDWKEFHRNNPEAANKLLMRAFLPQERADLLTNMSHRHIK